MRAGEQRLAEGLAGAGPHNLINGLWRPPTGTDTEPQYNPSRGTTTGTLTYSSNRDLDEAVTSASATQRSWAKVPVAERLAPLKSLGEAIRAARPSLIPLISIEVGKTLAEANEEIELSCQFIETMAQADRWETQAGSPLGVVAGISLYHYPLLTPLWLMLPALSAGNGYVLRPCTWSPVSSVAAAELVSNAGYPDGLLNVVHGSLDIVHSILRHPELPAISYVGSGTWAQYVVETGSAHGKRVHAHGAVRLTHTVGDDADPVASARHVCRTAVGLAGQRWLAGCTVVADSSIASSFVDALCHETTNVRVGISTDNTSSMGPVIQRFRQRELVDRVLDPTEPLDVRVDGTTYTNRPGYFFGPTVIDHVPAGHPLLVEQVPGPIVRAPPGTRITTNETQRCDTVQTIHPGDEHREDARAATTWFGSLPWDFDRATHLFTTP